MGKLKFRSGSTVLLGLLSGLLVGLPITTPAAAQIAEALGCARKRALFDSGTDQYSILYAFQSPTR